MPSRQAKYFLLTIPFEDFTPFLHPDVEHIKGQLEKGNNTNYLHWQVAVALKRKGSLLVMKHLFGDRAHIEFSRSAAIDEYVFKDDTAIENTRFEFGKKTLKRASGKDWDLIRGLAESGDFKSIPSDVYIRSYSSLKKIFVDNVKPMVCSSDLRKFWGRTGSGKSKRAWEEASLQAYPKSPTTVWWCGYQGHANVVIDEFRGQIGISHMLRWLDRYPVLVEVKGSTVVLECSKIWITSNIAPEEWYPDLDKETQAALRRRFSQVIHFN
ncbi:MAG: Rep protein [CRESS virus sp. ctjUS5]|uniref:Replication-associated protein n=1 Tax=CRESS virus sp. ctjUS5 TaxID=2656687 RepID=A0A5Q2WA38_9VIRU|nr:MAG: Rep protein [CRESS virus sp. ctjUS5]